MYMNMYMLHVYLGQAIPSTSISIQVSIIIIAAHGTCH